VQGGRSQRTPRSRTQPGAEPGPSDPTTKDAASARPANIPGAKPEWNLVSVHVPEVWSLGQTGAGVVVASLDTGVDLSHPDLRRKWRGGTNSWYDPHGEEASPYDAVGHGTQSMGVIAGGPDFGIAPDVRWIAARLYNGEGKASLSDIHLAFQWLMDPDGDPDTRDAPDIVNASWALTGRGAGTCTLEFNDDIRALKSAGIAVVFAAGNDGPFPNTSNSPGNNPGVLSVGAIDRDMELARQTSRGPSACDGSIFPTLLAPGVNIRTADLSYGGTPSYTTVSGTSLAAPHAAGILALLAGAFPRATVDELEKALIAGSVLDKSNSTRRIDALGAYNVLLRDREFVTNGPAAQTVSR
jgi:serine protease AprX